MIKDSCSINIIHEDSVKKAMGDMPEENILYDLSEFMKMFSDYTRLKIIHALISTELCVCDISTLLDMSQSSISHQLRVLKQARIVKYRKEGKVVYYSIHDEHVKEIILTALSHIKELS